MALLRDTMQARTPWSPETGDGLSVVERSPPDMGAPHSYDPCRAIRAAREDTVVVRPVGAALGGWDRASPHSWRIQSLGHGKTHAAPLQRVAGRNEWRAFLTRRRVQGRQCNARTKYLRITRPACCSYSSNHTCDNATLYPQNLSPSPLALRSALQRARRDAAREQRRLLRLRKGRL